MICEGLVLKERYRLTKPLGRGSQAIVWVAEHLALGSLVAVKLIDPDLAKQEDALERFQREATAAAKLRSAHVVQILDHGVHESDEGEQPFIVMELLDGEDLFQRIERVGHLSVEETSRIVTHVARALTRAHAERIIHRDLKPENVFITNNEDEEIIKVLDFGVAKVLSANKASMSKTGAGTLIGTPHYMSPEQVKGIGDIDYRSDLWSLAVIAYQAVTSKLPFDSEGVGDLLIRITLNTPARPSSLNPELSPEFDAWFEKASSKDPDKRYQTARELADALAKVAGLEPKPSTARGARLSADLDWASEFTNSGLSPLLPPVEAEPPSRREVFRVERTPKPLMPLQPAKRKQASTEDEIEVAMGSMPPPPMKAPAPVAKPLGVGSITSTSALGSSAFGSKAKPPVPAAAKAPPKAISSSTNKAVKPMLEVVPDDASSLDDDWGEPEAPSPKPAPALPKAAGSAQSTASAATAPISKPTPSSSKNGRGSSDRNQAVSGLSVSANGTAENLPSVMISGKGDAAPNGASSNGSSARGNILELVPEGPKSSNPGSRREPTSEAPAALSSSSLEDGALLNPNIPRPPRPPSPPSRDKLPPSSASLRAVSVPASASGVPASGVPASSGGPRSGPSNSVSAVHSLIPPPELNGSGKRRMFWVIGVGAAIGAVGLTATVIRSQMAANSTQAPPGSSTVTLNTGAPVTAAPTTSSKIDASPALSSSASPSSSSDTVDPSVMKKGPKTPTTPNPNWQNQPHPHQTTDQNGEVEIWTPMPDKEVPKH